MRTPPVCRSCRPGGRTGRARPTPGAPGQRRRRRRVSAGTAASGSTGTSHPLDLCLGDVDRVVDWVVDWVEADFVVVGFPRLLELGAFFPLAAEVGVVPPDGFAVVAVEDFGAVVVVLVQDFGAEEAVVVVDDADAAWAWVIWMVTWPSLESEFPSLATKLKASTSTPAGAW